jgi:hypothetical protein
MKRFLLFAIVSLATGLSAQITKQDFEYIFKQIEFEKIDKIRFRNMAGDILGIEGTDYWKIDRFKETYALKDNAFYLVSFADESKNRVNEVYIVPYDKIKTLRLQNADVLIDLVD